MTTHRSIPIETLDRELAALTAAPETVAPAVWEAALERTGTRRPLRSMLTHPLPVAASASILGLFILAVLISIPFTARVGARRSPVPNYSTTAPSVAASPAPSSDLALDRVVEPTRQRVDPAAVSDPAQPRSPAAPDRHVIRKAQIDIRTEQSVRIVFLKAQQVVSEARGEYIESASLTNEGRHNDRTVATLTLRVAADRLSEVLGQLRELGIVASENTTGEDVTDRVVDLEARLRNEQRIEAELLELLNSRQDASLADILQLRTQIAGVRGEIERLTAQRDRLGRLVALATVLVTIQPVDDKDKQPDPPTLADYFTDSIKTAWHSSLRFLIDTAAFLVRVAVGGLVWWLLLLAAILTVRAAFKRRARTAAAEPAPMI